MRPDAPDEAHEQNLTSPLAAHSGRNHQGAYSPRLEIIYAPARIVQKKPPDRRVRSCRQPFALQAFFVHPRAFVLQASFLPPSCFLRLSTLQPFVLPETWPVAVGLADLDPSAAGFDPFAADFDPSVTDPDLFAAGFAFGGY